MWRTAALLLFVLFEATADIKTGVNSELVQRLKRSPQYDNCGPPGPPPRPYWPPPPPPPFWRHHRHPPHWGPPPYEAYSHANSESNNDNDGNIIGRGNGNSDGNRGNNDGNRGNDGNRQPEPCKTCGDGNNAISNAKSESGQAVAVAIARAGTPKA